MPEITETKLKEQIAKEQIGSLYFLYGDEKLLVRRNLNRLLKKLDGNFPEFNFQEFPHDAPVDSIADAVVAMPFMAERKCVTVSDLNVEAMNTAELDKLYELLDTIPETTVLILYLPTLEIDPKKSAKWRTFLKKLDTRGFSLPSLRLKDNELEKYVCREAEKANCLLSRKLAERIVDAAGNLFCRGLRPVAVHINCGLLHRLGKEEPRTGVSLPHFHFLCLFDLLKFRYGIGGVEADELLNFERRANLIQKRPVVRKNDKHAAALPGQHAHCGFIRRFVTVRRQDVQRNIVCEWSRNCSRAS